MLGTLYAVDAGFLFSSEFHQANCRRFDLFPSTRQLTPHYLSIAKINTRKNNTYNWVKYIENANAIWFFVCTSRVGFFIKYLTNFHRCSHAKSINKEHDQLFVDSFMQTPDTLALLPNQTEFIIHLHFCSFATLSSETNLKNARYKCKENNLERAIATKKNGDNQTQPVIFSWSTTTILM